MSRILPLSKPNKKREELVSYRPINNLLSIEKIFEEHISINLQRYLKCNNILNKNHHGGRKSFSTTTALLEIINKLNTNYDKNLISALFTTDLSAAYDTVDIDILLNKLTHYGITGNELELFKNYFTDRKQYVCIDTFNSDIRESPECSVVQGSKLSGLMYNIYTNEVPLLHKLMKHDIFTKLTHDKTIDFNINKHDTINFVDDSTSIISFSDQKNIRKYLENYYNLIHAFYNTNRLKINPDKTSLMIVTKPKLRDHFKKFTFMAKNYEIKAKNTIKILGVILKKDLKWDSQIGNLCGQLHNRIYNIRKLTPVTTFKIRLNFIKSFVVGKLIYAMPIYMGIPNILMDKFHKVIMTGARAAIGNYCMYKSVNYIFKKCNIMSIKDLLLFSSLSLLHKLHIYRLPECIMDNFLKDTTKRTITYTFRPSYLPKLKNMQNGIFYRGATIFNDLPDKMKILPHNKFQQKLKLHLNEFSVWDSYD